jgi:hypothetical protein
VEKCIIMGLKITIVLKRIDEDKKICDFLCSNFNSFLNFYREIPNFRMTRVFCDRQKCDPQFVRQSDLQFVRPMQNASFVRPIHKMRHLSDLPFVRPIYKMCHLSDLYIKCVICPIYHLSNL